MNINSKNKIRKLQNKSFLFEANSIVVVDHTEVTVPL